MQSYKRVCRSIIFEILDKQVEIHENSFNSSSQKIENLDGMKIEFENVSFKYPATDQYSLKDVSFKIADREFIGIIGSTGSGKSTIFNLFAAFYLPTKEKLIFNGVSIEGLSKSPSGKDIMGGSTCNVI